MTVALVLARSALALVFAAAGWGKLIDRKGTSDAFAAFGVPRSLVGYAAAFLPLLELVVAVGLLLPGADPWPAATAVALLAVFSAGIANSLLHGRRPACHCFGQLSSSPASWTTVARNAALAAVAAFIVVAASEHTESGGARTAMQAVLAVIAGAFALFLASRRVQWLSLTSLEERAVQEPALLAAVRAAMRLAALLGLSGARVRGLPLGSRAPEFRLRGLNGTSLTLASLLADGKPALLVFGESDCKPCVALMPTVTRWQNELRDRLTVALITSDAGSGVARDERQVASAYDADVTPSAVLISPEGRIASRLAVGELPIRSLVESVVGRGVTQP